MFDSVLIANRGEIALRIARACRELGIRVIAVHSTEDADSVVTRFADQSIQIGPAPARRSYLNAAAILEAASRTGAQAIHPGYGFLSEDPDFAEACAASGITLIGPPASVMARLGDKAAARSLMASVGLPLLPGSLDPLSAPEAEALARGIGYPVIIKAVAGGGGRGMSVVRDPADFVAAFRRTQAAAQSLFADGRVYVERYLESARHVEVQVLCDGHGNGVHLGERDCTVQRRHQKLVEETPAPRLPPGLAERIGDVALRGALAAGYVGAGTFEFLLGPDDQFYFMEVNCRIQVEHPVTEMVYGIDLVQEQIKIAAGRPQRLRQDLLVPRGVAIECRVNAEDPAHDFRPAPGVVEEFVPPGGPFVRVDTHAQPGLRVTASYDSLLAKLVVWAPSRGEALARMRRALDEFHVRGPRVRTTIPFLRDVLDHELFREARHSTSLVEQMLGAART